MSTQELNTLDARVDAIAAATKDLLRELQDESPRARRQSPASRSAASPL
jgi:hypothetical protein